jgi:predicted RNase H-like nuclease
MIFAGIDFGWLGKPSGLAILDSRLRLKALDRIAGLDKILAWVDGHTKDGPAMIAVDAPLVVVNETGMREAERSMHRHYGRYHAGCYPANLSLAHCRLPLALSAALESRGFAHAAEFVAREPGRYQIEVHPHAACVNLFDLAGILKYKKGTLAARRPELIRYRDLLRELMDAELPEIPSAGAAMKAVEDQLDALLAAYVGAHYWRYGAARSEVHGSREGGYIVVPRRERKGEKIKA